MSLTLNPEDEAQLRLQKLLADGELAIVSAGFRCFTKIELSKVSAVLPPPCACEA